MNERERVVNELEQVDRVVGSACHEPSVGGSPIPCRGYVSRGCRGRKAGRARRSPRKCDRRFGRGRSLHGPDFSRHPTLLVGTEEGKDDGKVGGGIVLKASVRASGRTASQARPLWGAFGGGAPASAKRNRDRTTGGPGIPAHLAACDSASIGWDECLLRYIPLYERRDMAQPGRTQGTPAAYYGCCG